MKIFNSPSKKFQGEIHIHDPLTLPMILAIEEAQRAGSECFEDAKLKPGKTWSNVDDAWMPAILKCVEKFEITGFPEIVTRENFPASPRIASRRFITWLINTLADIYIGEEEIPNE